MVRSVLVFFLVTNFYLYVKLRSGFGRGAWRWVYLPWALVWMAMPFLSRMGAFGKGRAAELLFSLSFTWVAAAGMACGVFLFMDAASLGARIVDGLGRAVGKGNLNIYSRFFAPGKCVPVTLLLILTLVGYSFYEAWNVRRVDWVLETRKLPEGVGRLRVVHLTDIHIGGLCTPGRVAKVMDIVRAAEPDLLVMTGDLTDGDMSFRGREAELLAAHGARYGAFFTTGNHDFYSGILDAVDFARRAGFTVLRDRRLDVAGITLVGLDDIAKYGRGMWGVEQLPGGVTFPEDRFVLLLKHRPQVIEGTEGKFDLQLSGHTHGGQIWPFSRLVRWVNRHAQHLSFRGKNGESAVYVSNGAGFWGPPLRFLVPPEVTVIDLVKKL